MSDKRSMTARFLIVSLWCGSYTYPTHQHAAHVIVHMPVQPVYILVHQQRDTRQTSTGPTHEHECVIDMAHLRYATDEQRYVNRGSVSRVELFHAFMQQVVQGCCSWFSKEKLD